MEGSSTAPSGMTRFVVKSKLGVDRDFEALGPDGQRAWYVDGKFGPRPAAEVQDSSGTVTHRLKGRLLGIPKKISVSDAAGNEIASIKAKISPLKSKMVITLADGGEWLLKGNLIEKDYTITSGGAVVAVISQKFLAFVLGSALYVARMATGFLAVGMLLHALWDFGAIGTEATDSANSVASLFIYPLGILALVAVFFIVRAKNAERDREHRSPELDAAPAAPADLTGA